MSFYMCDQNLDCWSCALDQATCGHWVEVEYVSHAKWIPVFDPVDGYDHYSCSDCHLYAPFNYIYISDYDENFDGEWVYMGEIENGISEHRTDYCPHCGAKMDSE